MPRHLAIGDIHGCLTALETLCDFVGLREDDVIITLGDYVDRGPDSKQVLDRLLEWEKARKLYPLRGNHEFMMCDARENKESYDFWINFGGDATLDSYASKNGKPGTLETIPDSHWQFIEERLLPYYEIKTHFFVHANVDPKVSLADQRPLMLYWQRLYEDTSRHISGKIMICGHTSQKSGLPLKTENAICIDTWAYGDGWLTCLDVESGTIWQANENGDARQMNVDELENS